ncbi:hypothetical protein ACH5RR_006830 [Cinchona calisaya]|uniref:Uncharacterized protein n=1 Tax=Cinchona calisaya TaxID=153742 RepID=A0ABD3AQ19_9GENT
MSVVVMKFTSKGEGSEGIEERMHIVWDTMVASGQISVTDYVRFTSAEWLAFTNGKVEVTIAGGRIVWEKNELKVNLGSRKYIEMPPFSYLFDGVQKVDASYTSSIRARVKRFEARE